MSDIGTALGPLILPPWVTWAQVPPSNFMQASMGDMGGGLGVLEGANLPSTGLIPSSWFDFEEHVRSCNCFGTRNPSAMGELGASPDKLKGPAEGCDVGPEDGS